MVAILNIRGELKLHPVCLFIHTQVRSRSELGDGISGEVGLTSFDPGTFVQITGLLDLSVLLASPVDTDQTGISVIWGTYIPTRVAITPKT